MAHRTLLAVRICLFGTFIGAALASEQQELLSWVTANGGEVLSWPLEESLSSLAVSDHQ